MHFAGFAEAFAAITAKGYWTLQIGGIFFSRRYNGLGRTSRDPQ
jgi:hypothetical protein